MEFEAKVEGLDELEDALLGLGADLGAKTLKSALMASSKPMLDDMKRRVPVESGRLKKTLGRRSKIDKKGTGKTTAIVRVGAVKRKNSWRAQFVEFGTSKTQAQPFIRPALDKSGDVVTLFETRLKSRIDKEVKKQKAL